MTLNDSLQKFINYQKSIGNTNKTISSYISHLNQFIYFMNNSCLETINYNDLENYIIFLRSKKIESVSIRSYVISLKAFLHWAYNNRFIADSLHLQLKIPRYKKKAIVILSNKEMHKILNYFNPYTFLGSRNNLILTLMLDAGLRLNEVVNLTMLDFKLEQKLIKINGKGQKQRYVPLTPNIKQAFENYLHCFDNKIAPLSNIFVDINGFPINQECIKSFFRRMRQDLNILNLHPHLLRHTFATMFLLNGGDPLSLQLILGHTTLTMTQKYVHFVAEMRLVEQMKYSPLSKKRLE